jgi:sugar/nucleoside kinase (ribokinase family)
MVDVLAAQLPDEGSRIHAEVSIRAGGSAVNAARAAASAGAEAAVIGRVGSDAIGDFLEEAIRADDVEPHLARDARLTTGVAVSLGSSVVAHRGANATLEAADIVDSLEADALLVSGFVLFQSGSAGAGQAALQRFRGRLAAVDLASPGLANLEAATGANVILATADEARAVTGAEPEAAARVLASRFELAVVKLRAQGALAAHGERLERAAAEPVERHSAFGAGDAFAGVLLVALARGDRLEKALQLACDAGARTAATSP